MGTKFGDLSKDYSAKAELARQVEEERKLREVEIVDDVFRKIAKEVSVKSERSKEKPVRVKRSKKQSKNK